jgi:hypothetical protein
VDLRISDLLQRSPNRQMELFNKLDDLGGFNCRLARHSRRAANSGKCREKGAAPQLARLGYPNSGHLEVRLKREYGLLPCNGVTAQRLPASASMLEQPGRGTG